MEPFLAEAKTWVPESTGQGWETWSPASLMKEGACPENSHRNPWKPSKQVTVTPDNKKRQTERTLFFKLGMAG